MIDVEILVYRKNCNVLNEKLLARIAQTPYDVIVLHAAWQHPDYPMDYAALGNKLDLMLKRIKAASPATRVILVSNVPRWYLSPEKAYYQSLRSPAQGSFGGHRYAPAITLPDIDRVLSGVAQRNGVVFISPVETLCLPRRFDAQHRLCTAAAESAGLARAMGGAQSLARIFHEGDFMPGGNPGNLVHAAGVAQGLDGQNGLGAGRDGRLGLVGIHVEGFRVDIHKDGLGAGHEDDIRACDEGKRGRDDFIAGTDAKAQQTAVQPAVPLDTATACSTPRY